MTSLTSEELWRISCIVLTIWTVNGILIFFLLTRLDTIVNVQLYNYGLQFSNDWAEPYWSSSHLMMIFLALPIVLSAVVYALAVGRQVKKFPSIKLSSRQKAKAQKVEVVKVEEKVQTSPEEKPEEEQLLVPVVACEPKPEPEPKPELEVQIQTEPEPEPIQVAEVDVTPVEEAEQEPEKPPEPASETEVEVIQPEVMQVEAETEPKPRPKPQPERGTEVEIIQVKEESEPKEDVGLVVSCPKCGKVFNRPLVMLDFASGRAQLVNICPFCNHILGGALDSAKKKDKDKKPENTR